MLRVRNVIAGGWLVAGLLIAPPLFATDQEKDIVRYGDEDFAIRELPLNDYLIRLPAFPRFDVHTTANWKAYRARWAARDSRFYLTHFAATTNGQPASAAILFPERKLPLVADWYSGTVHIIHGRRREARPYEEYERITALSITNGLIVATNVMRNMREHFDGTNFVLRSAKERPVINGSGPTNRTRNR